VLDGEDLRALPLHLRKNNLARLLRFGLTASSLLRFEEGEIDPRLFPRVCEFGLEGFVSKRRDRPYRAGPSKDWPKIKKSEISRDAEGQGLVLVTKPGIDPDGVLKPNLITSAIALSAARWSTCAISTRWHRDIDQLLPTCRGIKFPVEKQSCRTTAPTRLTTLDTRQPF
jgi:hypothetical protein